MLYIPLFIVFAISPIGMWLTIGTLIPERLQGNKLLGCILPFCLILNLLHNAVWLFPLLTWAQPYEDLRIIHPDPSNKRHVIREQHLDEGAIGDHYRTIEAYEIIPGVRWVVNVTNE